jgi:hypothetical protein
MPYRSTVELAVDLVHVSISLIGSVQFSSTWVEALLLPRQGAKVEEEVRVWGKGEGNTYNRWITNTLHSL